MPHIAIEHAGAAPWTRATGPAGRPRGAHGQPSTLTDMLPAAHLASRPVDVEVGSDFDIVVLPEEQARRTVDLLAHRRPHPVGAAVSRPGEWVLFLPPRSGLGTHWRRPATHYDSGTLQVPPVLTACGDLRWARLGNAGRGGRFYTAPLMVHPLLPLLG
ncbi:hypothetical protein [Streptomyces canus]|uniref:hypothetical protein n=1 Tax=Streptomyces canus TaxID=58343 RepID=UPI0032494D9C